MKPATEDQFDLVLFGATSFVGQIITQYLSQHLADSPIRWALAGRSAEKLHQLLDALPTDNRDIPVLLADANDPESLRALCHQTQLVMTTVGPYDLYGEPMVKACVETGTDYCDLTGEPHWIKKMLDQYESTAQETGARIVHCTGFDSIPSDLGVWHLQNLAKARFDSHCNRVKLRIRNMRGAASGGTIATALNMAEQMKQDPQLKKQMVNPYILCPEGHGFTTRQHHISIEWDDTFERWTAPFFMAPINTKIVHRTNALLQQAYGKDFQYDEGLMTGPGFKGKMRARSVYWGLGAFFAGIGIGPIRALLKKFVLPKPGEGPSPEDQERGFYDFRFFGQTPDGEQLITQVYGDRDPGYGSTAKIMAQTALCMVQNLSPEHPGGFWTPASLLGQNLIDRLQQHAGVTFKAITAKD